MNKKIISFITVLIISAITVSCQRTVEDNSDFPLLTGPYLGQKPPGLTPEVFAPNIISTPEAYEINSVFSPDGSEFYYAISASTPAEKKEGIYAYYVMHTRIVDGAWTKPERLPLAGKYNAVDIALSPERKPPLFLFRPAHILGCTGRV